MPFVFAGNQIGIRTECTLERAGSRYCSCTLAFKDSN